MTMCLDRSPTGDAPKGRGHLGPNTPDRYLLPYQLRGTLEHSEKSSNEGKQCRPWEMVLEGAVL